jgi:hypothetical protein
MAEATGAPEPDTPTQILVDTGAGTRGRDADSAASQLDPFVGTALAGALASPKPKTASATNRAGELQRADCSDRSLPVRFGGDTVVVTCDKDALLGYVSLSWMMGGFPAVLRARQALDAAIDDLHTTANKKADEAAQTTRALAHERSLPSNHDRDSWVASLSAAADRAAKDADAASAAAADATACRAAFAAHFNDAWRLIATMEEELLRIYESQALDVLKSIATKNRDLASASWDGYKCYLGADAKRTPITIANAPESAADVRLLLDPQPDVNRKAMEEKYAAATDLSWRAASIVVSRQDLDQVVDTLEREGEDAKKQRDLRERELESKAQDWNEARGKVAASDPALLQVYSRMRNDTTLREFERLVVQALLDAYRENNRILAETKSIIANGPVRIEPAPSKPGAMSAYTDAQRHVIAGADLSDAFEKWQLTIPASVVVAQRLTDADTAKNSVWLHLPVRLAVPYGPQQAGKRFSEPGTFEQAAVTHLWDALEDVRHQQQKTQRNRILAMWIGAAVLAPFTGGGSLVAAGMVAAGYCFYEIYEAKQAYNVSNEFSTAVLTAMDVALWTRPSTVDLVRTIAARTLEAGGNLVPAERIPFVVWLAFNAMTDAILPPDRAAQH